MNAFAQRCIWCECPVTVLINLRRANQDAIVIDADDIAGNTDTGERRRVIVDHGVTGDKTLNRADIIEFLRESRRIGARVSTIMTQLSDIPLLSAPFDALTVN